MGIIARHVGLAALVLAVPAVGRADVDWAAGQVTANGLGVVDRHAPSPAAGREPARRAAIEIARQRLAVDVLTLPLATGGTIKSRTSDPAIKARIDRVVGNAITVDTTPHTDGSWSVRLAVPIEALRLALAEPRTLASSDSDPPIVVLEGVTSKPAVGFKIGKLAAATIWVKSVPGWAIRAPRVKAEARSGGVIVPSSPSASPGGPSTLFVIVTK